MSTSTSAPALGRVDTGQLQRVLDGPWADIRDRVREGLARPELAPVDELPDEEYRDRVLDQARRLAAEGDTGLGYPEEYGGRGQPGAAVAAFETLAHGDLSLLVKVGVQFGLCGGAIHHLGSAHHHERYLRQVATLELPGCFAMTETGHGSDVQSLRTTATYDPHRDAFVLHTPDRDARKDYIGNAARHGRIAVVFAQLVTGGQGHGVHAFVVPIRDEDGRPCPGVTIEDCGHKIGLNGVDNGRIWFDHVEVPLDALLDRYGKVETGGRYSSPIEDPTKRFFTMLGTLVQGRISVGGAAIGATKNALTIAVRYGLQRRQFSPPGDDREILIMDYLGHQRKLLPRLATTYALTFAQQELVAQLDAAFTTPDHPDEERRRLESHAAGIKALATWHASETIQTCREACGGAGYLSENLLGRLKADIDVFTTFEGDNTVLLQLVAKGLLTGFRDEFRSLDTLGTVLFVADQFVDTMIERTRMRQVVQSLIDAVPGRDEEEAGLRDRGYQLELLRWREEHVLEGVARRLKRGIDAGDAPFDVFNRCQDHVLLAARAHIERVILEAFVTAIDACEQPGPCELLDRLCDLHALSLIERERGWFLEHGRLSAARAKAVIAEVNSLCGELRPHVEQLVDAFAIPDQQIAVPMITDASPA